jgi:hypothetical protein
LIIAWKVSTIATLIIQTGLSPSILASDRDKLFWSGLWIYSLATGIASMIFMAWAFYEETLGHGALFIEPNRVLAAGELATVATGMVALFALFLRGLGGSD